jgi:hypothetical protein
VPMLDETMQFMTSWSRRESITYEVRMLKYYTLYLLPALLKIFLCHVNVCICLPMIL